MAIDGGEWLASRPGHFTPGTHCIGGWVASRAGLEAVAKRRNSCPCWNRNPVVQPVA